MQNMPGDSSGDKKSLENSWLCFIFVCGFGLVFFSFSFKAEKQYTLRDDLLQKQSHKKIPVYSFTTNRDVKWTKPALSGGAQTVQTAAFEHIFEINICKRADCTPCKDSYTAI